LRLDAQETKSKSMSPAEIGGTIFIIYY
jgi:hypothetical protein